MAVCGYAVAGPAFSYGHDPAGRLLNMTRTDVTPAQSVADTAAYNEANQLVSYTANNILNWERRQYDTMRRLTSLRIGGGVPVLNVAYNYTAGYSPGKITSMTDSVANQTVSYSYDSLNRLASAAAAGGSAWSQTYSFDGFGNLTGNGNWTQSVNAANNQISTLTYDANGNQTQSAIVGQSGNATLSYDVENRLTAMVYGTNPQVTIGQYAYNPSNQRVWRKAVENGVTTEYFYFYGIDGKREATYKVRSNQPAPLNSYTASLAGTAQDVLVYFGGETIQEGSYNGIPLALSYVTADRLGSMPGGAKLDPYGQELSATANDKIKFATYLRDGESGIDYAVNRYYAVGRGRFLTVDPTPGRLTDPQSLNRYTYAAGDPINRYDPNGAFSVCAGIIASDDSMDGCSTDPSPVMDPDAAGTVQGWDDFHGTPHPTGTASLDALVDAGIITGWSFVNGNRDQLSLSFQAQTAPIAIGVCVAQPELCVAVGGVISITIMWPELKEVLSAIQHQITSRDAAPVKYKAYDAGRDKNGNCKPVDPEKKVKWKGTGGDHWHWIEWNQTKDCMSYPTYKSGPDPGPDYNEISR